jgi:hypothetical protein
MSSDTFIPEFYSYELKDLMKPGLFSQWAERKPRHCVKQPYQMPTRSPNGLAQRTVEPEDEDWD